MVCAFLVPALCGLLRLLDLENQQVITTRLLPPEDWSRLADTSLKDVWRDLQPKHPFIDVLVAEDESGAIVGHILFQSLIHCEGFGIAPSERRQGRVFRAMLTAMAEYCDANGFEDVWSGSVSDEITDYLSRLGARPIPGVHFVWSPSRIAET